MTHVGAGVGSKQSEVDAAMRAFSTIIAKKRYKGKESLRQFTPFLTSLLEHLLQMTSSQVRKLFMLLFTIGADTEELRGGGVGAQDGGAINEASIIIKKYLSLQDETKKRIVSLCISRSHQHLKYL